MSKVKGNIEGNDYDTGSLSKAMDKKAIYGDIVRNWRKNAEGLSTFCFCVDTAHGKHATRCFVEAGIAAEYMDAKTPKAVREEIFERYRIGETKIIVSIGVLIAGVDEDVRAIVMARPTKSPFSGFR